MIALLCPSRGRPEKLKRMWDSAKATGEAKLYYAIAPEEKEPYSIVNGNSRQYTMPDNMPTVHKWNMLAEEAMRNSDNKLFMLASDDMIFATPEWDKALLDHYNSLENKIHVYHLQDSRDKDGTPHPIVTRDYIEKMGWFLPPIFLHWFCDSRTVSMAKYAECFTHLRDYELIHDKPSDHGKPDETHSRIREWGWHDRDKHVDFYSDTYFQVLQAMLAKRQVTILPRVA